MFRWLEVQCAAMTGLVATLVAIVLAASSAVAQQTWFVDADATGANSGTSWADAFVDLQAGLAVASGGGEIWVAEGAYKPDGGTGDKELSFVLESGVRLYGGFTGVEVTLSERDPALHPTILSGDLAGDDTLELFKQGQNLQDNSRHVVVANDVGASTVLDGFVLRSGAGGPLAGSCDFHSGGGLGLVNSSPLIRGCVFTMNRAIQGGACSVGVGGAPRFDSCVFIDNISLANGGGAIAACDASPTIIDCRFEANRVQIHGSGGAIVLLSSSTVIRRSVFVDNFAGLSGAALWVGGGNEVMLDRCQFFGNRAWQGGALGSSTFQFEDSAEIGLIGCVFSGNESTAGEGGAIRIDTAIMTVQNTSFVGNRSSTQSGAGISVEGLSPSVTISDSILWGNLGAGTASEDAQVWNGTQFFELGVNHCSIQGLTGTLGGVGNTGAEPSFVDADGPDQISGTEDDDLRLIAGSSGIDQGDPDSPGRGVDALGMPRRLDGDLSGSAIVDMGAFEFGNVTLQVTGTPAPGASLLVGVGGQGSLWGCLLIGHGADDTFVDPFGALLIDGTLRWTRMSLGPLPSSSTWPLPPQLPPGASFTLQAIGIVPAVGVGNLSNAVVVKLDE